MAEALSVTKNDHIGATDAMEEAVEADVKSICAHVLGRPSRKIRMTKSFLAQGGDSLLAIKFIARCFDAGYVLSIHDILQSLSLKHLCQRVVLRETTISKTTPPTPLPANPTTGQHAPSGIGGTAQTLEQTDGEVERIPPDGHADVTALPNLPRPPDPFSLLGLSSLVELDERIFRELEHITTHPKQDIQDIFPCSPIQEVFLISQNVSPELYQCSAIIEIKPCALDTPLDVPRLISAWERLVMRHASLRTIFVESVTRPGHFDQVVFKECPIALEQEQGAGEEKDILARRSVIFDDHRVPVRATLHQRSASLALLQVDISHALVDGESALVFLEDISRAYLDLDVPDQRLQASHPTATTVIDGDDGYAKNHGTLSHAPPAPFPPPTSMSYAEFVAYQQHIQPQDSVAYWKSYLDGAEPSLFPTNGNHLDRAGLEFVRSRVETGLGILETFCGRFNVTPANICQLAWALALGSYTASKDVCFSYVSSGRQAPLRGIGDTIGAFVDTMICRIHTTASDAVADVLARAKQDFINGLSHPCVFATGQPGPQGKALSCLRGNTIVSCQRKLTGEVVKGSGLAFKILDAANPSEYDLSVNIQIARDALELTIDFWSSRIDRSTAQAMLQSFQRALESILVQTRHDTQLKDIEVVPHEHIAKIRNWNKHIPPALETRLQDKVREQAALRPDALAIHGWDGDLTYHQLEHETDKLASYLVELGVRSEAKVPLCFEKSKWAIVSQLAVLKAGGCVVPLGIRQPAQRLQLILEDTESCAVLTTKALAHQFQGLVPAVVVIDGVFIARLASPSPLLLPCLAEPQNSAFIIYTSGSTGVPKGVVLSHASLCTSFHHLGTKFGIGYHTRMAQFSAYTFDISVMDIYLTLQHGGCLCIISEDDRVNNLGLAMASYQVNHAAITSTVANTLTPEEVPALRTLALIGEAPSPAAVGRWINNASVFNAYGPSESSVLTTLRQLTPVCNPLNIGFAFAGAVWVADANDHHQLVPIGAPGELLIEGPLLAREYLKDPVKTAGTFVGDPEWVLKLGLGDGRRLYRTGDLVRQMPDGSMLYIGRRDMQIKVRGQRVEVGDIEHHLIEHDSVLEAAVLYPRAGPCRESLVALVNLQGLVSARFDDTDVVLVSDEELPRAKSLTAQLADHLVSHVPDYMIPSVWIPLASSMPRSDSAKLNRKRLHQWVEDMDKDLFDALNFIETRNNGEAGDEPVTATQLEVQKAWAQALNLPPNRVPIQRRSFLSLGGDSIAAMRVVSSARSKGISLTVRDILQSCSVEQLAKGVENVSGDRSIHPDDESQGAEFPLSSIQRWYFESNASRDNNLTDTPVRGEYRYNQSVCFAPRQPSLDPKILAQAIRAVVSRHSILRARFRAVKGNTGEQNYWRQRIVGTIEGSYHFAVHDLDSRDKAEAIMASTQSSIDPRDGPVFAVDFIRVNRPNNKHGSGGGEEEGELLFMTAHRLVIDTTSWSIILHNLDEFLRERKLTSTKPTPFRVLLNETQDETATQMQSNEAIAARIDAATSLDMTLVDNTGWDYWGLTAETNLHESEDVETVVLDGDEAYLVLGRANEAFRTQPEEIMLTALLCSFQQTFPNRPNPVIFNEVNRRDRSRSTRDPISGLDASGTVGWLSSLAPIFNIFPVPNAGIKYNNECDVLRYIKDIKRIFLLSSKGETSSCQYHREMEICFSYRSQYQQPSGEKQLFKQVNFVGRGTSPQGSLTKRPAVFGIEAWESGESLQFGFKFSRNMVHQHQLKVREWGRGYITALRSLATDLASITAPVFTLTDFPLLQGLDYDGLDQLRCETLPGLGIQPRNVEDIYPCSPVQQGMLIAQAKDPSAYLGQQLFRLTGPGNAAVDTEAVARAWQTLVDRHPMLRTIFIPSDTEGAAFDQVVLRSYKANIKHQQWSREDDQFVRNELTAEALTFINDDDNDTDGTDSTKTRQRKPAHKLIISSAPSNHAFIHLVMSHALADAASVSLLLRELVQAYDGKLVAPRDGLGPPYSTYVSYLGKTSAEESVSYWAKRLANVQPCHIPSLVSIADFGPPQESTAGSALGPGSACKPRPAIHRPRLQTATADVEASQEIRRFCRVFQVTPATVFQLAWAVVLSKYTGSTDATFGYLSSGRDVPVDRIHELVGPLINTIVTHVCIDPSVSLHDALRTVQDEFVDGFAHQRASLMDIWHALGLRGESMFNTCLSYRHDDSASRGETAGLILDPIVAEDPTEYDATVTVLASGENMAVSLHFSPDFMSLEAASGLIDCFVHAVKFMVCSNPIRKGSDGQDLSISDPVLLRDIQVLSGNAINQLRAWNDQVPPTDNNHCIHDRVRQQELLRPNAPAVCAWDGDLTHEELGALADQLAAHLSTKLGVGPECSVALCMDKSRWAIIAQLAVLRAGGVVLPINPAHPLQRLQVILRDSDARIMLTAGAEDYASRFAGIVPRVLQVNSRLFSHLPSPNLVCMGTEVKPENAAFIIYTSGSTGVPKGVVLTHSALLASFQGQGRVLGIGPDTRTVQFSSYTFDVSIGDIWVTIVHGGCVCVISEEERMNRLQEAIRSYRVNAAHLTPTVASLLDLSSLPSLKALFTSGEPLKRAVAEQFLKTPHVRVINTYAPSECCIYALISGVLRDPSQSAVLGRPIAGSMWVIDGEDHVCPIGAVGELWIGGPAVGRGYLNDKTKTDKAFVTNPPWIRDVGLQGKGLRFYRTGDLVRQDPSTGDIIFVGRRDMQVKIRGQRVEVGEIEYRVNECLPPSSVKDVVVSLVVPPTGNPVVAAILELEGHLLHSDTGSVSEGSETPFIETYILPINPTLNRMFGKLRTSLADALPSYMIPGLYVPVSQFPQTTSGKTDRRQLGKWLEDMSKDRLAQYFLAEVNKAGPTTETEEHLRLAWATALGVEPDRVGVYDHFLHSGGDSLIAMRLVSLAGRNAYLSGLTVLNVFQSPRLVDMARLIDDKRKNAEANSDDEFRSSPNAKGTEIPRFALWKEIERDPNFPDGEASGIIQLASECSVVVDAIEDIYPATPLQEGLMAVTAQQRLAYIGRWTYRLSHEVDVSRLKGAWQKLAAEAPILRTRIVPGRSSGALQVVIKEELPWLSLASSLDEYLEQDTDKPMTYGSPLIRLAAVEDAGTSTQLDRSGAAKDGAYERYFVLTAHHSVYDGWSMARMFEIVSELYRFPQKAIPRPPPFTHFIRYLSSLDYESAGSFWRSQLTGFKSTVFPPLPRFHKPSPSDSMSARFPAPSSVYSPSSAVTLATILRAAWVLVVAPHGANDVLFAMPLSGRDAPVPGIADMIAPTIATVPVRTHVDPSQPVCKYLAAAQKQSLDFMSYQHIGLQNIRRLLDCSGASAADFELHQLFVVQSAQEHEDYVSGNAIGLKPVSAPQMLGLDGFALTIECITSPSTEKAQDVDVRVHFDNRVVSHTQMKRLLDRFGQVFAQIVDIIDTSTSQNDAEATAMTTIRDINLIGPEESAQLARWNGNIPSVQPVLVHELVRRQALLRPTAPAVCAGDGHLSHEELDRLSGRLARRLVAELGVGPEVMVATCFEKSKWAVVAILAVLRAGGVVVSVRDRSASHLRAVLDDTRASVLLTTKQKFPELAGKTTNVVVADKDDELSLPGSRLSTSPTNGGDVADMNLAVVPDNTAFVVYASGPTGVPKGSLFSHGAIATGILSHSPKLGINAKTRSFQSSDFGLGSTIHDIFAPIIHGGCVCIPSEREVINNLDGAIRRLEANHISLTPDTMATLRPKSIPSILTIIVSGEILRPKHVNHWVSHGQTRVINAYSSSETCVPYRMSEIVEINRKPDNDSNFGGGLWIVDLSDYNRLLPIGAVGELLIEGPSIAKGYLNDAEKAAASIIENPSWTVGYQKQRQQTRRMYRTGKLAMQNDDGSLTYVGRVDSTSFGRAYARHVISRDLTDGDSAGLIVRDIVKAHDDASCFERSATPYGTYINLLHCISPTDSLDYWTSRLDGAEPCYLPPSPTPLVKTGGSSTNSGRDNGMGQVTLELHDIEPLCRFRDAHGVTIANMVQLAWALVLSQYTGSRDVLFRYFANCRDAPADGMDEIVAPLVNTTVSRICLECGNEKSDITVLGAIQHVQSNSFEALNYQRTSLGEIQHALGLSERSLFNTALSYASSPVDSLPGSFGLSMPEIAAVGPTEHDANLAIVESDAGLQLALYYRSSYLDKASAEHILDSLHHLLFSISSLDGNTPLKDLSKNHMSPSDLTKIKKWNSVVPIEVRTCVHDRIYQQLPIRPNAPAVCAWDGQQFTFSELCGFSDQLAIHLRQHGVNCGGVVVGLCFEKSIWAIVATLAVLRAGGIVLPLGFQLPLQRLQLLIEDAGASVVLTTNESRAKFGPLRESALQVIVVDTSFFAALPQASIAENIAALAPQPSPDDVAFIIYTSGSTGRPKGVLLTHAALSTSLEEIGASFGLNPGTRAVQFSAYVFDASLIDILGTLRAGGCVCVISESHRLDVKNLAIAMEAMNVNFAFLTPTVACLLDPHTVPSVQTLGVGGERVPPEMIELWYPRPPSSSRPAVRIIEGYGPSECTIAPTITGPLTDKSQAGNIGTPRACVTWVVDQDDFNFLVPIGAVGELLIEGPILSPGYLGDPEKTAASFIMNPEFIFTHGMSAGGDQPRRPRRMYRTGDLVRQSPVDGTLTYVGRKEGQVKIRGQRVETGEIEHVVKRLFPHARMVAASLAFAHGQESNVPFLAVALELPPTHARNGDENGGPPRLLTITDSLKVALLKLQSALADELPSYMVPSLYCPISKMPVTISGKLNRKVLDELLQSLSEQQLSTYRLSDDDIVAEEKSMTETERQLRDLWLLSLSSPYSPHKKIGPVSHFFRSGGDSVTAMRLVSLVQESKSGVPLPLTVADVFKNPVLSDMARVADRKMGVHRAGTTDSAGAGEESVMTTFSAVKTPFSLYADRTGRQPTKDDLARLAALCENTEPSGSSIEDVYPCTPLQEGLMSITTRVEEAYISRFVFELDDTIDVSRLRASWQRAVESAPILRTRIIQDGERGAAVQVVLREELVWSEVESDIKAYVSPGPTETMSSGSRLSRFAVITDNNTGFSSPKRFFVWAVHHSVYDGWSFGKLLGAVSNFYFHGVVPKFEPFTHFIGYIQDANSSSDAAAYWSSQLRTGLGPSFPPVKQGSKQQPSSTQVLNRRVCVPAIKGNFTTATLLRAAWALLLATETGSAHVVFPTTLSGRTSPVPGILDIIGPTISTVPVHIHVNSTQKIEDYLEAIQQQAAEMIPYEHTGLQNIRRMLPGSPSMDVFRHLFVVQPSTHGDDKINSVFPGLSPVPLGAAEFSAAYPLVVECKTGPFPASDNGPRCQALVVDVEARFDQSVLQTIKVESLLEQFEHLILQLQAAAEPRDKLDTGIDVATQPTTVADIDVMSPHDMRNLRPWNPPVKPPLDVCLHRLVEQQCAVRPDSPAVSAWDGEFSYSELDDLASRLAHRLVSNFNVGTETKIAIIFEKSKWVVVAELAVLKAGGVVVPCNHQHPSQRIRLVLEASEANVVLTSANNFLQYRDLAAHVLAVGQELLSPFSQNPESPVSSNEVDSTNAAFIIFTSGSTGTPKGVILEHGSLATGVLDHGSCFAGPDARVLQFSAYTFDASISEIFSTLILGGCVCIPSEEDRVSNLGGAMRTSRITGALLTPTVASLLKPADVPTLRSLAFGAEALKPEVLETWLDSGVDLYNLYGPTECSIVVARRQHIRDLHCVSNIGTSVGGSNLWVVDAKNYHRLVPIGNVGELVVEGPLLSRGYLNDEEKTNEVFVSDPHWARHELLSSGRKEGRKRLFYRTGDLVQQEHDGSITYIGRRDTQIKIHGQRIEVGEIESWIKKKLLGVREAVGGLIDTGSGLEVLAVALEFEHGSITPSPTQVPELLVMSDGQRQTLDHFRGDLSGILPNYAIPRLYFPMSRFPLTDSGKLDRRAIWSILPKKPEVLQSYFLGPGTENTQPSSLMEIKLQKMWATVLDVSPPSIGAGDDFFARGGDSISAIRLVSNFRQADVTGVSLTVADVFNHPILSDLAALLDKKPATKAPDTIDSVYRRFSALESTVDKSVDTVLGIISPQLSTLNSVEITDAAPCTDFQTISVIASLQESRDILIHVSLEGEGDCDVARWTAAWRGMLESHESLRTAHVFYQDRLLQVVLKEYQPEIRHFEAEQGKDLEEFVKQLILDDMHQPPHLGRPFAEFAIITQPSTSKHRVLFRICHSEYDGISMSYYLESLKSLYLAETSSAEYTTPSRYMYSISDQANKDKSLEYWRTLLKGSYMPQIRQRGAHQEQHLQPRCRPKLLIHASQRVFNTTKADLPHGVTASAIIRTAWALVLSIHTGRQDVIFGELVSGRNAGDPVAERAVGCCVNVVPVRAAFSDSWSAGELVRYLQRQQVERIPHETVGFCETLKSCEGAKYFTTRINHVDQEVQQTLDMGGDEKYNVALSMREGISDVIDVSLVSVSGPNDITITMNYLEGIISSDRADDLMTKFGSIMQSLLDDNLDKPIRSLVAGCSHMFLSGEEAAEEHIVKEDQLTSFRGTMTDAAWVALKMQQQGRNVAVQDVLLGQAALE